VIHHEQDVCGEQHPHMCGANSGVQRGGEQGAGPGHPSPGGHPKSEIAKTEML